MTLKRCFPPVVDANTRMLILGSLPGEVSLAQGQYYANRQNHFWRLVGDILGEDLVHMDYTTRLQTLLAHRIGLWDVVAEAKREGSLDSKIRDHAGNDLMGLIESLPKLAVIAFNGGAAERIGLKALGQHGDHHHVLRLPSSSPAHTVPYSEKLHAWRELQVWLTKSA
ncbi:DNA-deoxyinosine glycosylase [Ralstonia solanacearum]|uniref:DNA-deoxyinosine glycosylase n=1 Tax=Ralstonia solanacearum TaxID=305 RepID=UPI0005ABFF6B|nr:DNA-deoxyinosine glycosylase [Ralstonia solanacearum]MDC6180620.1 DNA-deoxyinosine glycosylase [Ralstonia solanacearum]MDC6210370.1 DNA-deoxyinosine glycosylase [Ralstonia solanacearum]MDC6242219.1 DNA-deoxyinosine glycosylase [Ralstonia solanacearum]MDD7800195.1 DNA-deoxyinosine glycosylase [Ralstonia solanacearum]TYZ50825.1 DNA-deoxyinosine glycosylase [Ralstonia solanacearum]